MTMDYLSISDENTRDIFVTMLQLRTLIPVLGAGFTKGERTAKGRVPDSDKFREIMLEEISKSATTDEMLSIQAGKFHEIAELFMNVDFVSIGTRKKIIQKCFLETDLSEPKKVFLSADWPYIYTLNVDDAIERNTRFRDTVLPYKNISAHARELNCVFKVHGDAKYEFMYDEQRSIIFSTDSYVQSLIENQSMLRSIRTDLVEFNTLFLGCSLDNEIDLLYALANYQGEFPTGRKSIYVTNINKAISNCCFIISCI